MPTTMRTTTFTTKTTKTTTFTTTKTNRALRIHQQQQRKKITITTKAWPEKEYVEKIAAEFPEKLMIVCSDGRQRAIHALETLDELGYVNIVGIKGGANLWNREWDAKMRRRNLPGQFKQNFSHGGDSPQLHGTGGQFQKADMQTYADTNDPTKWILA